MNILVTGGAGYIGSHIILGLNKTSYDYLTVDNFSSGHLVLDESNLIEVDINNYINLRNSLKNIKIDAIIHLASKSIVSESIENPMSYLENNIHSSLNIIKLAVEKKVQSIIFSSTAAVYGIPVDMVISEEHSTIPINPYGDSKLIVENILKKSYDYYGINSVIFRFFNAAGADPEARSGECHEPETHLIPNILNSAKANSSGIEIYGNDYNTLDGTCVRDYIHVKDIASAHLKAVDWLLENEGSHTFNLGTGRGYSVLEVVNQCELTTNQTIAKSYLPRRAGDPPYLVASAEKARTELGWEVSANLQEIIQDAWKWHSRVH
jgi:UDP-glucose 4-epimerase